MAGHSNNSRTAPGPARFTLFYGPMPVKTYFNNIQNTILSYLADAEDEIVVAVAWLTSKDLFEQLCRRAMAGVDVKVLILKDEINLNSDCNYNELEKVGGQLFWQENLTNSLMHHKFCVIDKKTVITGSFNWTNKASQNRENITIIQNEIDSALAYIEEFKSLIPIVDAAVFTDEDYLPNTYFDSPEKRLFWFESLSEKWQRDLEECADYPYVKTTSSIKISIAPHEYKTFDEKISAMLRSEHLVLTEIEELSGLIHLSNLKTLSIQNYAGGKKISDLYPLKNLIELEEIDISQNQIEDLWHLTNLKKLREINLASNKLTDISSLKNHRKIESFNFSENDVEDISPLQQMYNIEELDFSYNEVKEISALRSKECLRRLQFQHNYVEDITPLASCKMLRSIDCANNLIRDIEPLLKLKCQYLNYKRNPFK